jgi:hypothetical protein
MFLLFFCYREMNLLVLCKFDRSSRVPMYVLIFYRLVWYLYGNIDQLSFLIMDFSNSDYVLIRVPFAFFLLVYVCNIDRLRIVMTFDTNYHLFGLCISTICKPVFLYGFVSPLFLCFFN